MSGYDNEPDPELAAQDRFNRRRQRELARHPDCRDPDHPGCPACEPDGEDGDE